MAAPIQPTIERLKVALTLIDERIAMLERDPLVTAETIRRAREQQVAAKQRLADAEQQSVIAEYQEAVRLLRQAEQHLQARAGERDILLKARDDRISTSQPLIQKYTALPDRDLTDDQIEEILTCTVLNERARLQFLRAEDRLQAAVAERDRMEHVIDEFKRRYSYLQ